MDSIDFRSDTVTQPTPAMREAMATAQVGDDVFGDDPTINRLQELAASRMGKEAGLFVPSGTMGNLASILAHCARGDEAILGDKAHTSLYEAGGISALGGVHSCQVTNQPDGTLAPGGHRGSYPSRRRPLPDYAPGRPRKHAQPLRRGSPDASLHPRGRRAGPRARAGAAPGWSADFQCRRGAGSDCQGAG